MLSFIDSHSPIRLCENQRNDLISKIINGAIPYSELM